jgi:hypothetical protein
MRQRTGRRGLEDPLQAKLWNAALHAAEHRATLGY